jgi:hypothetical protein
LLTKDIKFFLFNILLITLFFINSIYWGLAHTDAHHFGHVFGNAIDFINGKELYKYISEQYGILNTILNAQILLIFGKKLINLILFYNTLYFSSIFLLFLIFFKISNNKPASSVILLLILISNPVCQLIWSNYLAFFFLVLSVYFLFNFFFYRLGACGFFLSLVFLSRESNFFSIIIFFLTIVWIEYINKKNNFFKQITLFSSFFFLPIFLFYLYLYNKNLYSYWIFFSKDLVNIYIKYYFFQNNEINYINLAFIPFKNIFNFYINSFFYHKNFRPIIFLIINIFCAYILIKSFIDFFFKNKKIQSKKFLLSVISLSQMTNVMHITEIFRFATGPVLGILVFAFFRFNIRFYILSLLLILLTLVSYFFGASQYPKYLFEKNNDQLITVNSGFFSKIKMSEESHKFYYELEELCFNLKNNLNVKSYYNFTSNSFLGYVCKLDRKQTFSFFFQYSQSYNSNSYFKKDFYKNYLLDDNTVIFDFVKNLDDLKNKYSNINIIKISPTKNMIKVFTEGYFVIILTNKNSVIKDDPFKKFVF